MQSVAILKKENLIKIFTGFDVYFQERRITPGEALNHAFVTLAHLVDYAHCNNVKASVQMMEVGSHNYIPDSALTYQSIPFSDDDERSKILL